MSDSQNLFDALENYNLLQIDHLLSTTKTDVNAKNKNDDTALMIAIKSRMPRIVEKLLKHSKIDVNAKNLNGLNALFLAVQFNTPDIMEMLLDLREEV